MKKIISAVSIIFLLICFSPAHAAIFSVFFDADNDTLADTALSILPGGSFSVDIYADQSLPTVYTMGFDLTYDATQLDVSSFGVGPIWGLPTLTDNGSGLLQFGAAAPFGGISGKILLGSANFICNAAGVSDLGLALSSISGGGGFLGDTGSITDISFGSLQVNQVPIPPTVLLLGAGLVGLVGIRRRVRS